MKSTPAKLIVFTLIISVTWIGAMPSDVQAMLVPANVTQTAGQVSRSIDLQTIQTTLESKIVRAKLHALGLSDAEIQSRLSRLSDAQIHQLASQMRAVHPAGGIIIGLLIAVLLVVLIIYFIKRI